MESEGLDKAARLAMFKQELESEEVTHEAVLEVLAPALAGEPGAYGVVTTRAAALIKQPWTCESLEAMLADGEPAAETE